MAYYVTTTFFESGTPKTGLSPTVDIYDLSDNSLVVNDGAMTEVGGGGYKYSFSTWDSAKDYYWLADSVSLTGSERYIPGSISGSRIIESSGGQDLTSDDMMRIMLSLIVGICSGGGTASQAFRDFADSKDRAQITVDTDGNKSAVTLDGTL